MRRQVGLLSVLVAFILVFYAHETRGDEFGPAIINQIKQITKNMTQAVDWRYCVPRPRKQVGGSCHTSAFGLQFMSSVCLSKKPSPSKAVPTELSLTDWWSCKTKFGWQHGLEVVNWWNQNGGFNVNQDPRLKWNDTLAFHVCFDSWNRGNGGRLTGPPACQCMRLPGTHNLPLLDPKTCDVQPWFLDKEKSMVHCGAPYSDNDDSWKNEILLAKLVETYGPQIVMSSVISFGSGNPNKPSHVCVREGVGNGHNYVVVGYNLTDSPHTAYWILSNSVQPGVDGYGYGRMFLNCRAASHFHPGAWGIGKVKASRYCLANDERGPCGGCRPDAQLELDEMHTSVSTWEDLLAAEDDSFIES